MNAQEVWDSFTKGQQELVSGVVKYAGKVGFAKGAAIGGLIAAVTVTVVRKIKRVREIQRVEPTYTIE